MSMQVRLSSSVGIGAAINASLRVSGYTRSAPTVLGFVSELGTPVALVENARNCASFVGNALNSSAYARTLQASSRSLVSVTRASSRMPPVIVHANHVAAIAGATNAMTMIQNGFLLWCE